MGFASQLFVPLPMIVTIVRRRPPPPDRWRRLRAIGGVVTLVGLAAISTSAGLADRAKPLLSVRNR